MIDAVVVGAGPNGLSAAVFLAQQGLSVTVLEGADEIGGGTRTAEMTVPGLLHDMCSALHPFGVASPYLSSLPLDEHGLVWRYPEIDVAHPLDDGTAAAMHRSLDLTAAGLGSDGETWRRAFAPLAARLDDFAPDVLGPLIGVPSHPLLLARFGLRAGLPASFFWKRFDGEHAKALFAGSAAHAFRPLNEIASSAVGTMLIAAGHRHGWPVAEGGSHAITRALASLLLSLGGTIETGTSVRSLADVPRARVTLFDTTPSALADIAGDRLPPGRARAYRRFKHGPGAYKLDLAIRGGIPWTAEECRRAGGLHLGGTAAEIAATEAQVCAGTMPEKPFVLVGQQYLADPTRSVGDLHPVWAYAHVPAGYTGDATQAVLDQIERFAPGFQDTIVAMRITTPRDYATYNPNFIGGDVVGGANTLPQLVARPVLSHNPYATGIPGVYLCSGSTPPGGGVHGMCGWQAAQHALRYTQSRP